MSHARRSNRAHSRRAICEGLSWIGVNLDEFRNRSASNPNYDASSRCAVHVFASQEDEQIARHTSWALVPRKGAQPAAVTRL